MPVDLVKALATAVDRLESGELTPTALRELVDGLESMAKSFDYPPMQHWLTELRACIEAGASPDECQVLPAFIAWVPRLPDAETLDSLRDWVKIGAMGRIEARCHEMIEQQQSPAFARQLLLHARAFDQSAIQGLVEDSGT
jgi:hypothetical protein